MALHRKRLQGKTAVITGSTSGIGEAIARLFAAEGAAVAVSGRRRDRGEAVAQQITDRGGEAFFVRTDVNNEEEIHHLVEETARRSGGLDILVNNAATEFTRSFMETTSEDFDRIIRTNLKSYFLASKYALTHMLQKQSGSILMINSVAAAKAAPNTWLYSAAKGAIQRMAKTMALELAAQGIRVNELCPGIIQTEIFADPNAAALAEQVVRMTPAGRIGTPEECAHAALYLVSEEAAFTTGASLYVDGGFTL